MALKGLVFEGGKPLELLLQDGIRKGLEKGDAQMARFVSEQIDKEEADDTIHNLAVEVVPYTIEDESLATIILKAPEYIIEEVKAALLEREARGLQEQARRLADEEADLEQNQDQGNS